MKITATWHAILREQAGYSEEEVQTNASSPAGLYRELAPDRGLRLPSESLRFAVNDEIASQETTLRDGDRVAFLPPVSGG